MLYWLRSELLQQSSVINRYWMHVDSVFLVAPCVLLLFFTSSVVAVIVQTVVAVDLVWVRASGQEFFPCVGNLMV